MWKKSGDGRSEAPQDAQDCILGHFQPSLRDWSVVPNPTQDCVLGYFQPELPKLAEQWPSRRRNLRHALMENAGKRKSGWLL
jgi:hypothetical protein